MKTLKILPLSLLLFISVSFLTAQVNKTEGITISGTKFTYPLIEKWIQEYVSLHPEVQIKIAPKGAVANPSDLKIIAHVPAEKELSGEQRLFYVSRYALLPVTSAGNPLVVNNRKTFGKKEIDKLFFDESALEEATNKASKEFSNVNVYSREGQACASIAFADYFGRKSSEIRGKKISGDDIFLLTAIQKDTLGITFNNLGYLFDLKTRQLKKGLAVLPLELKKIPLEYINTDVDKAIALLENNSFETIPVQNIGFIINTNEANQNLKDFLNWVATEGQRYNHDFGFLNLDKETLSNQIGQLNNNYITSAKLN